MPCRTLLPMALMAAGALAACAPPEADAGHDAAPADDAGTPLPPADDGESEAELDGPAPAQEPDQLLAGAGALTPAELEACRTHVEVPDFPGGTRDIEFLAFGDTQVAIVDRPGCKVAGPYRPSQQRLMIDALNQVTSQVWPTGHGFAREGRPFRRLRGVLVAGDLTEAGDRPLPSHPTATCPEFLGFESAYGLCGERRLRLPVYEGYGNHDFPVLDRFDASFHPVVGAVDARNPFRRGVTRRANDQRGHYAWTWDDIHFVNLNVKASGIGADRHYEDVDKPIGKRRIDPHHALAFLDGYLGSSAVPRGAQVMLMSHYGTNIVSRFGATEQAQLCTVLARHRADKGVRVIGWIHGHTHTTDFYRWACPAPHRQLTIPMFNVGSPFSPQRDNEGRLHFAAFRIGEHAIEAVDISVPAADPTRFEIPGHRTRVPPNRDNTDGILGGWAVRIEGLTPSGR